VQDAGDQKIPADVAEKLLRFARAGLATATMRGRSYLAMGGTSMGIAGSIVDPSLFEKWLGMRVESVDMTEFIRRIERGIYDKVEFAKALKWVKANCKEGKDWNSPAKKRSRKQLDAEWETSVKMALIARDLMVGNPKLAKMGFGEEAQGHHSIASGFQGQRQWTDHMPNGDFLEAILNSSFDWNGRRAPYIVATENDALNGAAMLFGMLLTNTAQIFADLRTYWSADAIARVSGEKVPEAASNGLLHLINSGPAALDGCGEGRHSPRDIVQKCHGVLGAAEHAVIVCARDGLHPPRALVRGRGSEVHVGLGAAQADLERERVPHGLFADLREGGAEEGRGKVHDGHHHFQSGGNCS
jgi:L-fucose isomerase